MTEPETERDLRILIASLYAQLGGLKAYVECVEEENKSLRRQIKELDKAERRD